MSSGLFYVEAGYIQCESKPASPFILAEVRCYKRSAAG
ncbi:hypothetical protein PALA111701_25485 [Paenibacillus lactis]|uniref:Uncharacterized protein n=2 Tax=Paenibacillus lactis TaxID=228574 RepID=G4HPX2_9BACL|nr:hypothetical protein PaelaDRAFT_6033 [Paenibacillus lactis 154]MBP1896912.1 hypothetical protein [Paenibacillus lactis]